MADAGTTDLEYTDAPPTETTASAETMQCPLCGQTLPKEATRCTRCDWVRDELPETAEGKASDAVAVLLSILPGLGHIYKGHRFIGLLLMFFGTPCAIGAALLAATGTAGFGLGLLPLYWFGVMFHVYAVDDRVATSTSDEGEEY